MKYMIIIIAVTTFSCNSGARHKTDCGDKAMLDNDSLHHLFMRKCGSCHAISKIVYGPALLKIADTSKSLVHSYDSTSYNHKLVHATQCDLKQIENYIRHNATFIDPKPPRAGARVPRDP